MNKDRITINAKPHPGQAEVHNNPARFKVLAAGRRWGKTRLGVNECLDVAARGGRAWWIAPSYKTGEVGWRPLRRMGAKVKAEIRKVDRQVILPGGGWVQVRSADDPQSLRGEGLDYAVFDECPYMREEAWTEAVRPALSDRKGGALFIGTPRGLNWFFDLYKRAKQLDGWASWTFKTVDNPYIDPDEIEAARQTMLSRIFQQEFEATFHEDNPGALWRREWIRQTVKAPDLARVVVAVDPTGSKTGDACGIITSGMAKLGSDTHFFVLSDDTLQGTPAEWGQAVVTAYHRHSAGAVIAEGNFGGEMVTHTIHTIDPKVPVRLVHASRGKQVRAEPVSVIYSQGRAHHVGAFPMLENELCQWEPGQKSPNRLDALVWGATELMIGARPAPAARKNQAVQLHKRGGERKRRGRR